MTFGLLNIHKPSGPTSHDIVAGVRRGSGERRVGHGGTLDPLAEGVLVLALGRATRLLEYMTGSQKAYDATIKLGVTTDSYDAEGEIVDERPVPAGLSAGDVERALDAFRGTIQQIPPVYSAVKVGGRTAYSRARAGEDVELKPREVTISSLTLTAFEPPTVGLSVECSAGTYIRSLAHDLGQALGTGAMLSGLVRTGSGPFRLADAVGWAELQEAFAAGTWRDVLLPADVALSGTPQITLNAEQLEYVRNGRPLTGEVVDGFGRAYAPDGQFVAVLEGDTNRNVWRPKKVFL